MPKKFPEEFQRDAVAVARRGGSTPTEVAADFGISESTLKRCLAQADIDDGVKDGHASADQNELVQLRRRMRRLEMENEIFRTRVTSAPDAGWCRRCAAATTSTNG